MFQCHMKDSYLYVYGLDNRLQLSSQICLEGKKKLAGKRITGFQVSISILLHPSQI